MRALGLAVTALTLAAALAPVPALACGMVMREPVNLAELMEDVDQAKVELAVADVQPADDKADDKAEATVQVEAEPKKVEPQPNS